MGANEVEIKIFKAADLRRWLYGSQSVEGLTTRVISATRANAILQNPYIREEDPVVAAIYEAGNLAAYTAAFPDEVRGKRIWCFSTLWCHKNYRGKGYALIAVGSLCEEYGEGNYVDMWGAPETVEIFRYMGLENSPVKEYTFEQKHIVRESFKGELLYKFNEFKHQRQSRKSSLRREIGEAQYKVQYTDFIDDSLYGFITAHAERDLWPRTQEMMNWILRCSFKHCTPLMSRSYRTCYFGDRDSRYWKSGVKVYVDEQLVGFYIISDSDKSLSIKYLYYEEEHRKEVFASIAEHIFVLGNNRFSTRCEKLAAYLKPYKLYDQYAIEDISFSHPESFEIQPSAESQGGDGDGFV